MTIEEVFKQIGTHMIEGLMMHSQMSEYYLFLGLEGYAECHQYHYFEESWSFQDLILYYIKEFNKLLPMGQAKDPGVISQNWYKYARNDVDAGTRKTAIKTGMEKWIDWEKETKMLYENMYKELLNAGEVAAAHKVKELVLDVDEELRQAEQYYLDKKITDYDMAVILEEQKSKKDKYEIDKRSLFFHK